MRHLLKRHRFAVEAYFDFVLALTFAVPASRLEPLLYPGLETAVRSTNSLSPQ